MSLNPFINIIFFPINMVDIRIFSQIKVLGVGSNQQIMLILYKEMSDITSVDINSDFKLRKGDVVKNNKYNASIRSMREEEAKLIGQRGGKCPVSEIGKHLGGLDTVKLEDYVKNNFDNPDVMKAMSCLTEGIYYHSIDQNGKISNANAIVNWFSNLRQIGPVSATGVAMISSLKDVGAMAVIKSPLDPNDKDLVHELFVGMFGTNLMRSKVPNFAYIYGGFQCSPSIIDEKTKDVVSICGDPNKPPVQYVIYEAITPGKDLRELIKTTKITPSHYLSILLQIAFATTIASDTIGWTHYDLHTENVLTREVPRMGGKPFFIEYQLDGQSYYLLSTNIATIIDFGRSRIIHGGKSYGYSMPEYGVIPTEGFPLFDIYRLLMDSSYMLMKTGNLDALNVARVFYSYFNKSESLEDAVNAQTNAYNVLPREKSKGKSIRGLLQHVFDNIPSIINVLVSSIAGRSEPLLGCNDIEANCHTANAVYRDISVDQTSPIGAKTIIDFFDEKTKLTGGDLIQLKIQFSDDYTIAMENHLDEMDEMVVKFNDLAGNIRYSHPSLSLEYCSGVSPQKIFTNSSMEAIKEYFTELASSKFIYKRLNIYIIAGKDIAGMTEDLATSTKLDDVRSTLEANMNELDSYFEDADNLAQYISTVMRSPQGQNAIKNNESLKWYTQNMKIYL